MTDRSDNSSVPAAPGPDPTNPYAVEVLEPASCWSMLRSSRVGRIAACVDGHPHIFPVTFVVDGESIVFRTARGTKLAATSDAEVAFEVDSYDETTGTAASVIVAGRAKEIVDADEWEDALVLPLFPWLVAPMGHFVRITAAEVSGRRFRAPYGR